MSDNFKDIWDLKKPGEIDSQRHKERIRKAIKDNLRDLIAEENIISSKDGKRIKIPIRFLDLWRFKFGPNNKQKGTGFGEGKPGDVIAQEDPQEEGHKAGSDPGDDIYEEEVDLEEVISMMLEDLDLPWMESKKNAIEIETEELLFQDISEKGMMGNVDKRRTVLRNMRKNAMKGKLHIGGFEPNDLRFKVYEQVIERHSNASVFLIMDRSGSMTNERKYIVKSFFWWMVKFLERKYDNVELIFIAHDTEAKQVEEESFFTISQSGGTKVSSGFILAKKIIEEKYPISNWNNYIYSFSDGDNWEEDNDKCVQSIKDILPLCQSVGYGEIQMTDSFWSWGNNSNQWSTLAKVFTDDIELEGNKRFIVSVIEKREDIYNSLKEFLANVDGEKNEK